MRIGNRSRPEVAADCADRKATGAGTAVEPVPTRSPPFFYPTPRGRGRENRKRKKGKEPEPRFPIRRRRFLFNDRPAKPYSIRNGRPG